MCTMKATPTAASRIEDRDRHESRDEHPGQEDVCSVRLAQPLGLGRRVKPHGGELEIFASEQVSGGDGRK